jgi:repressor LexA
MPRARRGSTRELVYRFVVQRLAQGMPPTVREVQQAMGLRAVESARRHLDALVGEGRLRKASGVARGYRLAGPRHASGEASAVPILGQVQAGDLTAAIEEPDGYVLVESKHAAAELFALRVRGDSMVGAGILPGDVVVVRRTAEARSGDLVVAMVDGEATVKTLRRRGRRVELHPANRRYRVLTPDPRELRVLGVVVEVRRTLG